MGWTSTHRPAGMSTVDFFRAELPMLFTRHEPVAWSTDREAFYAAMRDKETGEVWAFVVLTERNPSAHLNYSYKELEETMLGPNVTGASKAVLAALTPTTNENAIAWREAVAARLARPVAKVGDTIRFPHPFTFSDGVARDTFVVEQSQVWTKAGMRNRTVLRATDGAPVTIPSWKAKRYEVLTPTAA